MLYNMSVAGVRVVEFGRYNVLNGIIMMKIDDDETTIPWPKPTNQAYVHGTQAWKC